MLIRQTAPVPGAATGNPYQQPGEWQVNLSFRNLESDTHYRLDDRQHEREELGTYVVNRQHAADLSVSHAFSERLGVAVAVPFVAASWSIPSPTSPALGPRAQQDARGIGDVLPRSQAGSVYRDPGRRDVPALHRGRVVFVPPRHEEACGDADADARASILSLIRS